MSAILSNKIENMIDSAFEVTSNSTHQHKIGCVIFDKKVISKTWNEGEKTHPRLAGLINKLHAEIRALKYSGDVSGACMVVVRGSRENPRLAKPCPHCLQKIKDAGIKRLIYSTDYGFEVIRL